MAGTSLGAYVVRRDRVVHDADADGGPVLDLDGRSGAPRIAEDDRRCRVGRRAGVLARRRAAGSGCDGERRAIPHEVHVDLGPRSGAPDLVAGGVADPHRFGHVDGVAGVQIGPRLPSRRRSSTRSWAPDRRRQAPAADTPISPKLSRPVSPQQPGFVGPDGWCHPGLDGTAGARCGGRGRRRPGASDEAHGGRQSSWADAAAAASPPSTARRVRRLDVARRRSDSTGARGGSEGCWSDMGHHSFTQASGVVSGRPRPGRQRPQKRTGDRAVSR